MCIVTLCRHRYSLMTAPCAAATSTAVQTGPTGWHRYRLLEHGIRNTQCRWETNGCHFAVTWCYEMILITRQIKREPECDGAAAVTLRRLQNR